MVRVLKYEVFYFEFLYASGCFVLDKFELFLVGISLLISVQTPLVGSKILQLKIFWV